MTNQVLIEELERCLVDMFEAEDKFHVLSYYIKDEQAYQCAKSRVTWFMEAGERVRSVLKAYKENANGST